MGQNFLCWFENTRNTNLNSDKEDHQGCAVSHQDSDEEDSKGCTVSLLDVSPTAVGAERTGDP